MSIFLLDVYLYNFYTFVCHDKVNMIKVQLILLTDNLKDKKGLENKEDFF